MLCWPIVSVSHAWRECSLVLLAKPRRYLKTLALGQEVFVDIAAVVWEVVSMFWVAC